jgi:hypothetical protein
MTATTFYGCFASAPIVGRTALCEVCPHLKPCFLAGLDSALQLRQQIAFEEEVWRLQRLATQHGLSLRGGKMAQLNPGRQIPELYLPLLDSERIEPKVRELIRGLLSRGLLPELIRGFWVEDLDPFAGLKLPANLRICSALSEQFLANSKQLKAISKTDKSNSRMYRAIVALMYLRVLKPDSSRRYVVLT